MIPLGSVSNAYDRSLVDEFRRGLNSLGLVENRDFLLDVTLSIEQHDGNIVLRVAMALFCGKKIPACCLCEAFPRTVPGTVHHAKTELGLCLTLTGGTDGTVRLLYSVCS